MVFMFCDFVFFFNGIKVEVIFNIEMILIVDVDLDLFMEFYNYGVVKNLKDW